MGLKEFSKNANKIKQFQSIYSANYATTKNEYNNNVERSDGLPEKQNAHLTCSPK